MLVCPNEFERLVTSSDMNGWSLMGVLLADVEIDGGSTFIALDNGEGELW